jgi:hypothetical protein
MRLAGYIVRMRGKRGAYGCLVEREIRVGKRPLGRPRRRWEVGMRELRLYCIRIGTDGGRL